jgi:predicted lipoprotein with Yx(FWY)xxD motif
MIPVVLAIFLVAAFFAVRSGAASGMSRQLLVRTTTNPKLHERVLVNRKGLTLYSLSAERRGRFICTDKVCLSLWTPLVVPKGTTPAGAPHLSAVRRPDGRTQVSYRGLPVYRFNGDRKPGDVKGNGFKDVGVWRPASPAPTGSTSSPPPNPYPGYPGYGG